MQIINNQSELDAALAAGATEIELAEGAYIEVRSGIRIVTNKGNPCIVARESSQPRIEAWESSQPSIEAWGSSQPRIVARESSQPSIEARESSQPSIEAWESSQPSIEAWGSSQPRIVAWGSSQPSIEAWESSQPSIEAWGSSQPRIVARESSQPRIVARESSQPSIEARESSQPSIEAWESSQPSIEAWESSQPRIEARESSQPRIEGKGYTHILLSGKVTAKLDVNAWATLMRGAKAKGGTTRKVILKTPKDWCDYYGVKVERGFAFLYKAVNDDYKSPRGTSYMPGTCPEAPDWDGGVRECGGGLHFSPSPRMAMEFHSEAKRFLICPVKLTEMAVHFDGNSPQKCKAKRVAKPTQEVDINGNLIIAKKAV